MGLEAEVKGEFAGRGPGAGDGDWDVTSCVCLARLFGLRHEGRHFVRPVNMSN